MIKLRQLRIAPKIRGFDTQKLSRALKQYRAKTAWGLDIGGHALKAVKITQASGGLLIEDAIQGKNCLGLGYWGSRFKGSKDYTGFRWVID